jgi:RNA polymerase sigma-B factor
LNRQGIPLKRVRRPEDAPCVISQQACSELRGFPGWLTGNISGREPDGLTPYSQPGLRPIGTAMLVDDRLEFRAAPEREDLDAVVAAYHQRCIEGDAAEQAAARDEFIQHCLPFAGRLARHYRGRGEAMEDLEQVARLGLVKAIDRFDPERGSFTAYAVLTIRGEIKKHFRDKTWGMHVTRRLQELSLEIKKARAALTTALSRNPTLEEIARHLDVPLTAVLEAAASATGHTPSSLNAPATGDDGAEVGDLIGSLDRELEQAEDRLTMVRLIQHLPAREQRMLAMRFYGNQSQAEIATALGISQMHVSRLLATTLAWLREAMLTDGPGLWRPLAQRSPHAVDVSTKQQGDTLVISVRGEIDHDNADLARTAVHQAVSVAAHDRLLIDLSGVPLLAAAGAAVLHDAARLATVAGRPFEIIGAQPSVAHVLKVTGLLPADHTPPR